ncbi:hypothetical protein AQ490_00315 [Wenjunlia vitaminophila]|uniref:Peptidase S8/S53 domain-containing protein n=1 Tax=Wenjunlia vitaminophila TaxID=76728 RepID=A0A0T6LZ43_WENVI|nr:hypothetical protein AQ490_00315 [Wenjunlia vitaminophila]
MAVGASLPVIATGADAKAEPAPASSTHPASKQEAVTTAQVTLVTGDTVTVTTQPDGKQTVKAEPAKGTTKTFQSVTTPDGDVYVYPSDTLDVLAAGTVDRALFNVTQLIEDGQTDARSRELPVILSYADRPSRATLEERAGALPASEPGVVMDRMDMAAVRVTKGEARSFWNSARPVGAESGRKTTAAARAGSDDVAKIWYDAPVKAALDVSVPQINAPTAWKAGYDGKGVKVAVLDTGVDLTHADVRDRVVGSANFVIPTASVQDGHGHGTHVASTIAGSGAASGGKYRGVAPGADLLIGKVLGDGGAGPTSGVIAGMEWAVDQGADVISMSLGSPTSTASTPSSEAVNRLSAASDALFVVAAGNDGPGAETIGSPGIADAALTVGAVDKSEAMAYFSSRGPRAGDGGLKPDITAPGVGIVAARATGTSMGKPVDDDYTAANGTSMATPHVAGAAALLAQRHPDWEGERIKAALTSHAAPSDAGVYEQGNGRVDVAASLDPELDLAGSVDFGRALWQETPYDTVTRSATVSNRTGAATTVSLAIDDWGNLPEGAVTLSQREVTVPANGTVQVPLVLDPNGVTAGSYSGRLTATTADGATAHTAIGFDKEKPRYDLTWKIRGRDGKPARGAVAVMGLDNDFFDYWFYDGQGTMRLPVGRYALFGTVTTWDPTLGSRSAQDLFSLPETTLEDGPVTVTIDGTGAKDFELDVTDEKRPLEDSTFAYDLMRIRQGARGLEGAEVSVFGDRSYAFERQGAIPMPTPTAGDLWASFFQRKREPVLRAEVVGRDGFPLSVRTSYYSQRFPGTTKLGVVDVGQGSAEELAGKDLRGRAALLHTPTSRNAEQVRRLVDAGASAIVIAPEDGLALNLNDSAATVPSFGVTEREGVRLADLVAQRGDGRVTVSLRGLKEARYTYSGQWEYHNTVPADLRTEVSRRDFATLKNAFHSDLTDRLSEYELWGHGQAPVTSFRMPEPLTRGHQRDDHVYAAGDMAYRQEVTVNTKDYWAMQGPARTYRPGQVEHERWYAPAMRPSNSAPLPCTFCRTDTVTVLGASFGGDSESDHFFTGYPNFEVVDFSRDGQVIGPVDEWWVKEKANYQLRFDVSFPERSGLLLGRWSSSAYDFVSAEPTGMNVEGCQEIAPTARTCEALPMILPEYDIPVDLHNRAAAGQEYAFTLNAPHAKGWKSQTTPITGAEVSVSYDDGETWQRADVERIDQDSFRVSYDHPELTATNGFVTLRTEVEDSAGNHTKQTIERAYALR